MLIAFASASEAMMKCVPLSKIAVVAFSPGRGFAAALPMLTPVKFTDQYFCTERHHGSLSAGGFTGKDKMLGQWYSSQAQQIAQEGGRAR